MKQTMNITEEGGADEPSAASRAYKPWAKPIARTDRSYNSLELEIRKRGGHTPMKIPDSVIMRVTQICMVPIYL